MTKKQNLVIYQSPSGSIELKGDYKHETIWASLQQIADLFDTDKSGVSRHINNIYKTKELDKKATVAKIATVQIEGNREITRNITYYNLDLILSVGYRVNSKTATKFRQWATKTLSQHITKGYTINKKIISKNYDQFLQAVETVKKLLPKNQRVKAEDAVEIVKMFASTWVSLTAYDNSKFPKKGVSKKQVEFTANELLLAFNELKNDLISKKQATELFATERNKESVQGIVGNIFQNVFGNEVYATTEEKAAHLLYFIVKNHLFIDGNKRCGAFAFVWFLNKGGLLYKNNITPIALASLTLLIAESDPKNKEKMIGLILLLLNEN